MFDSIWKSVFLKNHSSFISCFHEITTTSLQNVPFYKVTNNVLKVDIKGSSDALIILTDKPYLNFSEVRTSFQIGIGHEVTWIEHDIQAVSRPLDDIIISRNEFKTFWLTWMDNKVCFGEPYQEPFVIYDLTDSRHLNSLQYVGFGCMNDQNRIKWRFEVPLTIPRSMNPVKGGVLFWVKATNKQTSIPDDAIIGGVEDGHPLYVSRANYNGSITPGKYCKHSRVASLAWGGRERITKEYEFLCGYDMKWVHSALSHVPRKAFIAGSSEIRHEPLYIGRAIHEGHLIIGKVQSSHSVCYIPYKGREIAKKQYEILCHPTEVDDDNMPIIIERLWHVLHPEDI